MEKIYDPEVESLKQNKIKFTRLEQERNAWPSFAEKNITENHERKLPTSEQKEKMDKNLSELEELFAGSDLDWHLDGALNISLMKGEYIGNHKDVDLSLEKNELEEAGKYFLTKGYGLFFSQDEEGTGKKIMRRVSQRNFENKKATDLTLAAIDEYGEIRQDKELNDVDIHLIERNASGVPLGIAGAEIPEKWTQAYPVEFRGKKINISHPGKVLYYKLEQVRNYDKTDIIKLIESGKISVSDIDDIEKVLDEENVLNNQKAFRAIEQAAYKIKPEMNVSEIFAVLKQEEEFKSREVRLTQAEEKEKYFAQLNNLASEIFASEDKSAEAVFILAKQIFKIEDKNLQKREELKLIKAVL